MNPTLLKKSLTKYHNQSQKKISLFQSHVLLNHNLLHLVFPSENKVLRDNFHSGTPTHLKL